MELSKVDPDKLLKVVASLDPNKTYSFNAINISFYNDGKEVQPKKEVEVIWESGEISAKDEQLLHVDDKDKITRVDNADIINNKVKFTTGSFSTYTTVRQDVIDLPKAPQIGFYNVSSNPESKIDDELIPGKKINSGELSETAPEIVGYTYKNTTYEYQEKDEDGNPIVDNDGNPVMVVSTDPVVYLGAFLYSDEKVKDKLYIYYRTESQGDSDLIVKLADTDRIHINYEDTPHKVTYKVDYYGKEYTIGKDELPDELKDLLVSGPSYVASNTIYQQAVKVSLPRGYSATVKMSNEASIQEPKLGEGSETTFYAEEKNNPYNVLPDKNSFTINGVYTIKNVNEPLTVTINLTKRASYTFSAVPAFKTVYFKGLSSETHTRYVEIDGYPLKTNFNSNEHTFKFKTYNNYEWAVDSFNINKESINVPFVNSNVTESTITTILTSGTVINLTAEYQSGRIPIRTYTLKISNCYENITITGGNLHNMNGYQEWSVSELTNIEDFQYLGDGWKPLKIGEVMTFATDGDISGYYVAGEEPDPTATATHYYWSGGNYYGWYYRPGYYKAGNAPNPTVAATHYYYSGYNYKSKVIKFKLPDGYINPQIKYLDIEGNDQYTRVHDVSVEAAQTNSYHRITSDPESDGYYYFSLHGSNTNVGQLSIRADLALYDVSYSHGKDADNNSNIEIEDPEDNPNPKYDGSGYNIDNNSYVVVDKTTPVDPENQYIFLYYKIKDDDSGTRFAPSQKVELNKKISEDKKLMDFAVYDDSKDRYVIPFVSYWKKKVEAEEVTVTAKFYVDDEYVKDVNTTVTKTSSVYIDIDSKVMSDFMKSYDWQLFYDEQRSNPFINDIQADTVVKLYLYSKFYVYNSGTDTLELHTTKEAETVDVEGNRSIGTINFYDKFHNSNYLYGGLYKSYSKADTVQAAADDNNEHGTLSTKDIEDLSNKKGVVIASNLGVAYDPKYENNTFSPTWTAANAITDHTLKPGRAAIYYIKDVPKKYLQNYVHCIFNYSSHKLDVLYPMTVSDDLNYRDLGIEFTKPDESGSSQKLSLNRLSICRAIPFNSENSSVESKILSATDNYKADGKSTVNVFSNKNVYSGYLCIYMSSDLADAGQSFNVKPYWITPDKVTVYGTSNTINTGEAGTFDSMTIQ